MRTVKRLELMKNGTLRIGSNREITPRFRGSFYKNTHPSQGSVDEVGEFGMMIIENLFFCPGIVRVTFCSPYDIEIEKGLAFSWKKMMGEIDDAFSYCLHFGTPSTRGPEAPMRPDKKSSGLVLRRQDPPKKPKDS